MRSKHIFLTLSFSIAAIRAAPIGSLPENESINLQLPLFSGGLGEESFEAFAVPPPSSFLIEFDLPPAGLNRRERIRMESNGEFQGFSTKRQATVAAQHHTFRSFLSDELQLDYVVRHQFLDLLNGLSIDLQGVSPNKLPKVLEIIRSTPGVVKVSPILAVNQPKAILHNIDMDALGAIPQLSTAHEQTGVLDARNKLGLTGSGVKVGIIDTGVDFTHEALGSCYGPGCKVQYGFDFVEPYREENRGGFDCAGHGTHVAGIIAGNSTKSNFFGVAPGAILGTYRVFPCRGTSKDDMIIAALERAYVDGMDVVNLSLGGGSSWPNTPLAKAAGNLASLGVVVVAAVGNDGDHGLEEVSSPSIRGDVISVASFEGSGFLANYFEVEGVPDTRIGYSENPPKGLTETPLTLVLPEHDPKGCTVYPNPAAVARDIVLIKRGDCSFATKAKLAQDAGALGCIFYNNIEGSLRPKVEDADLHIFGHGISLQQGQVLLKQFEATNSTAIKIIYKNEKGVFKNDLANRISPFSSWGLGPELELKPDIGAPGGYIYSTVPVNKGSYATMSGTSMATPFVAGSAALLLEADPAVDREEVLGILQMYSKPGMYKDTNVPDSIVRQGAGMVHIFDAIQGRAFVHPTHLALNDTDHTLETYTIALTNDYPTAEDFIISHIPAMSILGYTSNGQPSETIIYNDTAAELVLDHEEPIHLAAGETRSFTFRFKPPMGLDIESHWIYSGYIKIEPALDASRPAFTVPYAGMHGSYNTVDLLDLQGGFPILLGPTPDGRLMPIRDRNGIPPPTYSMVGSSHVTLLLKISNPLRNLQVYVTNATKTIIGIVPIDGEHIGRTDRVRSKFFVVPWSGRMLDFDGTFRTLTDGEYSLVIIAPKPFSKSTDLGDDAYEAWIAPTIRIKH
ncbi:hypothetical protein BG011_004451 [Mortierella polycephala]|uniref:Subtilisin-like protein n=1 Tax=Mortierella polycephala TaxID=41804 RepID=A0A9P6Q1L1_9FUNG|nr:hypothetical protein BG011_004451 [Mortierella polycephala]